MKYQVKGLAFPGSVLHPIRGRIDLFKLNQKKLKELHNEGMRYVTLIPGDPPNEQAIEVKKIPTTFKKATTSSPGRAKKKKNTTAPTINPYDDHGTSEKS